MAYFYQYYKDLLFNEKWSDFTAVCGEERIPLHRAVVCSQSKFFEKVSESGFVESQTKEVNLPEDDPNTFKAFLTYLYTGNYDNEPYTSIMAKAVAAKVPSWEIDEIGTGPSQETRMTSPAELKRALEELQVESYKILENVPTSTGSIHVHYALRKADLEDPAEYLTIVRQLIQSFYTAVEIYSLADKYMVDRLRLLARNRFSRIGINLVTEAARRTKRKMKNPDDRGADYITDELWEAVAEGVDAWYSSTPEDPIVRQIPCMLLGKTHVFDVMRGEDIDDWDDDEPPFHRKIEELLLKYPDLSDEIEAFRRDYYRVGWRRIYSMW